MQEFLAVRDPLVEHFPHERVLPEGFPSYGREKNYNRETTKHAKTPLTRLDCAQEFEESWFWSRAKSISDGGSMKRERARISISVADRMRAPRGWLCALAGVGLLGLAAGVGLLRVHAQQDSLSLPAIDPPAVAARLAAAPGGQTLPGAANANLQISKPGDPNLPELTRECADLLKMATDLKIEVDKTNQDTLSVTVVRKADAIEQLARKVKAGSGKG